MKVQKFMIHNYILHNNFQRLLVYKEIKNFFTLISYFTNVKRIFYWAFFRTLFIHLSINLYIYILQPSSAWGRKRKVTSSSFYHYSWYLRKNKVISVTCFEYYACFYVNKNIDVEVMFLWLFLRKQKLYSTDL